MLKLIQRCERGDTTAVPALRKLFVDLPDFVDACGADLAAQAERHLITVAAGKNLAFKEALARKTAMLRSELAGSAPAPLERLLVERIVTCWLHLHDLQLRFIQSESMPIARADYQQRAIDHAHRRYLSAIKTLATVRKLALPALQVNIARKQVNVAG
jgi:hypothetical protein